MYTCHNSVHTRDSGSEDGCAVHRFPFDECTGGLDTSWNKVTGEESSNIVACGTTETTTGGQAAAQGAGCGILLAASGDYRITRGTTMRLWAPISGRERRMFNAWASQHVYRTQDMLLLSALFWFLILLSCVNNTRYTTFHRMGLSPTTDSATFSGLEFLGMPKVIGGSTAGSVVLAHPQQGRQPQATPSDGADGSTNAPSGSPGIHTIELSTISSNMSYLSATASTAFSTIHNISIACTQSAYQCMHLIRHIIKMSSPVVTWQVGDISMLSHQLLVLTAISLQLLAPSWAARTGARHVAVALARLAMAGGSLVGLLLSGKGFGSLLVSAFWFTAPRSRGAMRYIGCWAMTLGQVRGAVAGGYLPHWCWCSLPAFCWQCNVVSNAHGCR